MQNIPDRLSTAIERACRAWPRGIHAILSMDVVMSESCLSGDMPTMGVDRYWRLYAHPQYVEENHVKELTWTILHEASHCILRHWAEFERVVGTDWNSEQQLIANMAMDLAINFPLSEEEQGSVLIRTPRFALLPSSFKLENGQSWTWYYAELVKQVRQGKIKIVRRKGPGGTPGGQPGEGKEGEGQGGQPGDGQGGDGGAEAYDENGNLIGRAEGGSCADGQKRSYEQDAPEKPGDSGTNEGKQQGVRKKVAEQGSNSRGDTGLNALLDDDWNQRANGVAKSNPMADLNFAIDTLAQVTHKRGRGKRRYNRHNRRNVFPSIILPNQTIIVPDACLIIDTSGSMGRDDRHLAVKCVQFILVKWKCCQGIRVVTGDTSSCAMEVNVTNPTQITLRGGGGTDMAAIMYDTYNKYKPGLIVVATDGWTPWPETKLKCPCVAALTRPGRDNIPKWMHVVNLCK